MITGSHLRQARATRGLKREDLASLLGVSLKTIGNWERSQVPPDKEKLVRDKLFTETPLRGISTEELMEELRRRVRPDWVDVYGPDENGDQNNNMNGQVKNQR